VVDDPSVKWAIVGVGDIVRKRVAAAIRSQPNSTLYACVTRHPEAKGADLAALAPKKIYCQMDRMLGDPNVDAVYLATPVHLHAPHTIASLRAGKDVVVEKPMALDAREARQMCHVADQTGGRLAVAYYRRFWPRFQLVQDVLGRGDLGQVVLVRIALHSWYRPDAEAPGAWRTRRELGGGGVLADVGCHRLDLAAWWFGLPERLVADVNTLAHDYDVEDSAALLMSLAGGAQLVGSFHWNSKSRADEIHVVGTEGSVAIRSDEAEVVVTLDREVRGHPLPRPANAHYPLIDDFAQAVLEGRAPRFTGTDGMKATQIIDAIYESSRRKAWVDVSGGGRF
jgi:1,5-anhydro-D-fructose reductase (1,5-anhydro-D-mannitol-forming)